MSTTQSKPASAFKRELLDADETVEAAGILQASLVTFVDLSVLLKQAHWTVVGAHFRSVHLQLDEIIASTRSASDEIAERISMLGIAPDGRSVTVAKESALGKYPEGFQKVPSVVTRVADELKKAIAQLRDGIEKLGEIDPVSEDLCIGICGEMEKHLWMVQAQEE